MHGALVFPRCILLPLSPKPSARCLCLTIAPPPSLPPICHIILPPPQRHIWTGGTAACQLEESEPPPVRSACIGRAAGEGAGKEGEAHADTTGQQCHHQRRRRRQRRRQGRWCGGRCWARSFRGPARHGAIGPSRQEVTRYRRRVCVDLPPGNAAVASRPACCLPPSRASPPAAYQSRGRSAQAVGAVATHITGVAHRPPMSSWRGASRLAFPSTWLAYISSPLCSRCRREGVGDCSDDSACSRAIVPRQLGDWMRHPANGYAIAIFICTSAGGTRVWFLFLWQNHVASTPTYSGIYTHLSLYAPHSA